MAEHDLNDQQPAAFLSPDELKKRKQRNLAIALSLAAFIIIIFVVTIIRLGGSVAERSF